MKIFSMLKPQVLLAVTVWGLSQTVQAASFVGIAYPLRDATLSVSAAAVIQAANVKIGQQVNPDQVLLTLASEPRLQEVRLREVLLADRSRIDSGAARIKILENMLADADRLFQGGNLVSQDEVRKLRLELLSVRSEYETALAEKAKQEVELALARAELQQHYLRAPNAGVIAELTKQVGEWAAPGDAIIRLVDDSICDVRIKVSVAAAQKLRIGQDHVLKVNAGTQVVSISGRITFVSPVSDAASSLVDVRLRVPNGDKKIRAGSKVTLDVEGVN